MRWKRADRLLLLNWKKTLLIPAAWFVCVVLHNLIYGLLRSFFQPGWDEPFFFLLAAFVIPLYTATCIVYSLVRVGTWLGARSHAAARKD